MKTRVELDPQVVEFVRALAPEPRKLVRRALRGLVEQRGDIKQLEGELSGYCRLRIAGYRVIVRLYAERGRPVARCVFAERRSIVYEIFGDLLSRTRG
jgi:mRNA-degrading endonuclease RelE of RelBE toxin-antitoxin system